MPQPGNVFQCGEGVAVVLDPVMTQAWCDTGESWLAVNSRIVSVRLQFGDKHPSGSQQYVSIISVYAPTHRAPAEVKEKFYDDLQAVISSVPSSDVLLVMGDFNTRVGCWSNSVSEPLWDGVQGNFGVGKINESSESLLSFCALNQLCVMNTMFEKKRIQQYTWHHAGTKNWHCIDYVLMRQFQRYCCTDVTVFRSAQYWTDHLLLCATLGFIPVVQRKSSCRSRRFNVVPLKNATFVSRYTDRVVSLVRSNWNDDADGLTKWNIIRDRLLDASNTMLGLSRRHQPDWFTKAEDVLRPLIDKRNKLFSLWLQSQNHQDRQKILTQRHQVAHKVQEGKNRWYQEKANSIQVSLSQGRPSVMWQDIHAICKSRAGLQPVQPRAVRKQDSSLCCGSVETLGRWRGHFEGALNVESSFNLATIDGIQSMAIREEMGGPPTGDEVVAALSRIKVGKAAGGNGLLSDIVNKVLWWPIVGFYSVVVWYSVERETGTRRMV